VRTVNDLGVSFASAEVVGVAMCLSVGKVE
jgi:hypothetical protein